MKRFQNYIRDVIIEMRKVTWPGWEELKGATIAVIVFSLLAGAYIAVVDYGLMNIISWTSGAMGG